MGPTWPTKHRISHGWHLVMSWTQPRTKTVWFTENRGKGYVSKSKVYPPLNQPSTKKNVEVSEQVYLSFTSFPVLPGPTDNFPVISIIPIFRLRLDLHLETGMCMCWLRSRISKRKCQPVCCLINLNSIERSYLWFRKIPHSAQRHMANRN